MIEGTETLKAFGKRLKQMRLAKKKTQQFMADLLECTASNYQKIEYGQVNIPITSLILLADYFGVTTDYLLAGKKEEIIMPTEKNLYTYADICDTREGDLYELIDGRLYPRGTPWTGHASITSKLCAGLGDFCKTQKYRVFHYSVTVFPFNKQDDSFKEINCAVLPDVTVCERKQAGICGIFGPPKLVAEVFSDSTRDRDRIVKYNLYQQAGVEEYWMIDPRNSTVMVSVLKDGYYQIHDVYTKDETLHSAVFSDLSIELPEIFAEW